MKREIDLPRQIWEDLERYAARCTGGDIDQAMRDTYMFARWECYGIDDDPEWHFTVPNTKAEWLAQEAAQQGKR